jgi:7-carboxy-7-deazaguanine synthase
MPGGLKVLPSSAYLADEIKMPVGKQKDVETLKVFLRMFGTTTDNTPTIYLQPLSQSEKATELCIEQARQNGWRLSAQLHKYLRIR